MTNNNTIENKILSLMQESLSPVADSSEDIDFEKIALLASGKIDELDSEERVQLLEHIATNPEAARLVKELQEMGLQEEAETKEEATVQADTTQHSFWSSPKVFRSFAVSWAVAASLMIGLFIWNSFIPEYNASGPGTLQTLGNEGDDTPDYWEQLNNKRIYEHNDQQKYMEYAFTASTTACFILSAGLVICVLKRSPGV